MRNVWDGVQIRIRGQQGMDGKQTARTEGGGVGVEEHVLVVQVGEEDQHLLRVCVGGLLVERCGSCRCSSTTTRGGEGMCPLHFSHDSPRHAHTHTCLLQVPFQLLVGELLAALGQQPVAEGGPVRACVVCVCVWTLALKVNSRLGQACIPADRRTDRQAIRRASWLWVRVAESMYMSSAEVRCLSSTLLFTSSTNASCDYVQRASRGQQKCILPTHPRTPQDNDAATTTSLAC